MSLKLVTSICLGLVSSVFSPVYAADGIAGSTEGSAVSHEASLNSNTSTSNLQRIQINLPNDLRTEDVLSTFPLHNSSDHLVSVVLGHRPGATLVKKVSTSEGIFDSTSEIYSVSTRIEPTLLIDSKHIRLPNGKLEELAPDTVITYPETIDFHESP
jgi:hypothetical protein